MSIFSGINNLTQEKEREEYINKLHKARKAKYSNPEEGEPIQTKRGILDKTLGLLGYTGVVEGIYNMMDDDEESTFFSGLKEGFQYMNPRNEDVTGRHFMSDVLEEAGWIDNPDSKLDNVARGAVGLLGDIVLDPLTFINPYGSAAKVAKGSGVALDAAQEARRITNQAKTSEALKLLREGRYEDPNHIVGITHGEARNIITENYNKLGVTLTDDVLEAETNTLVKAVNKQGLKKAEGGKDFTLGLDNYPFMDKVSVGDKKFSDFRINLMAADRLRAIGDDSIAPYFNSLTRRMRYSSLYKKFNKNADWEKGLAKDFRGTTDQIYGWSLVDSLGNKGLKKLMLSLSEGQDLETAFQSLDEDIQKNFITLYENGTLKMAAKFLEQKGKIIERLMENEGKILKNIGDETERITNHINENRTRHAALSEEIKGVRKAKETAAKKIKNEFEDKYKDVTVRKVTEESLQKELDDLNIEHSQLTELVTKMGTGSFHGDLYTELSGIKSGVKVINMVMDLAAAQHHNNKWLANYKVAGDTRVSGLDFDWIARRGGQVDYSEVGNFNLKSNRHYLNEFDLNAQDYAIVKLSEEGGGIGESISSYSNKVDAEVIEKHLNKASGIKSDADGRSYIEYINALDKEKFVDWINVEFHNGRPKINYDISDNVLRDAQVKFLELKNASSKVEEEKVKRTLLDMFRPFIAREAYDKTFYEFVAKPLNEGAFLPSFMQIRYTTPRYIAPSMLVDGFSGRLFLGVNEFGKRMKVKFNLVPEIAGALQKAYLYGDKFINVPEVGLHSVESVKNALYQCAVELGFNSIKGAEDAMFLKYLTDINPKFYRDYYEQLMASAFNSSDELRDIVGNDFLSRMGKATDIEDYVFKGYSSMVDEATNFEIPLRNFQSANTFKIKPFKYLLIDRVENFKTKGIVDVHRPEKKLNAVVSGTPTLDSSPDVINSTMTHDSKFVKKPVVKKLVPEKLEAAAKKSTEYKFKELKDNMWEYVDEADVIAFTSNGIVKKNGFAVMGAGAAKEARRLLPNIDLKLGRGISTRGNIPMFLDTKGNTQIWNFPTKLDYKDGSSLELIEKSAKLLREQADKNGWKNIVVNSPGTGLGGLNYNDVAKILDKHFDERFIIARDMSSSKSTPSVKKTLEVSSKGDRRFSALYAKIERNGKKISIEDAYQGAKRLEDGSKPSKAKGFKPHHFEVDGKTLTLDEGSEWYKSLWKEYLDKNPDLVEVLKEYDHYVDSMAGKNVWNSQADAIKEYMDNVKKPLSDYIPNFKSSVDVVGSMSYAGIGSRETPEIYTPIIKKIAMALEKRGYTLRSGGAKGADTMFENSVSNTGVKEIYRPNADGSIDPKALELVKKHHPAYGKLNDYSKGLMARNGYQVLGSDLNAPSRFIVAYTKGGKGEGGTGQALRIAKARGIPIFDLGNYDDVVNTNPDVIWEDFVKFMKQINLENNSAIKPLANLDYEKMLIDDPLRNGLFGDGIAPVVELLEGIDNISITNKIKADVKNFNKLSFDDEGLRIARSQKTEDKAIEIFKKLSLDEQIEALEYSNDMTKGILNEHAEELLLAITGHDSDEIFTSSIFPTLNKSPSQLADEVVAGMKSQGDGHGSEYSSELLDAARDYFTKRFELQYAANIGEANKVALENNSAIKPITKLDIEKGIKSGKLKANAQYLPNSHAVDYSTLNKVDQILVDRHSMLIDDPIRIGMFGKGVAPVIDLVNSSESTIIAKSLKNEVLVNTRLQHAENKAIDLFKELSIEKQIEALEKTNDAAIKALDEFADEIILSITRFEIDELLSTDLFPRQFRFPHAYADMAIDKMKHGDYSPEFLDIAREHLAKRYDLLKMKLVGEGERFKTNFAENAFYKQLKKLDKEDKNKLIPPAKTKAMAKDAISEIDAYYGRKTARLVVSPETPLSTKYYTVEELDKELKKRLKADRELYNKRIRDLQEEADTLELLPDSETMAELLYTSEKAEQSLNRYAKYQAGKDYVSIDKKVAEEMGISYQFYKELDMLAKDDKTMAIYDMFSKKMREIAELEVKAGRLKPEQAEIMDGIYLPHILTDEAKDFINKSFVNPDSGKFNPKVLGLQHAYDKNRFFKSLDDVNRYLREGVGIDEEHIPEIVKTLRSNNVQQMFIDNVADIYIQRVVGSNKLLFGDEATDYFKYICGTPYTGAREMDHVVIHHPQLRRFFVDTMKYIKKHPDAFGDKFTSSETLAKYIGIDTRFVGPNTPFIPLEDFQIKLLNDIDFIVGGKSRSELFNMSDSVVSRVNVISRRQEQLLESQMLKLYDGFLNNWKLLNTVVHPGFHIQNAVSNAFQSFLGVGVDAFNIKRIKLARQILESGDPKQVVKLGGKEYTHQQLRHITMESRVLDNTFFNKDVTTKVYDFPLYSAGTKVGTTIEGTQRMNLFLSFMDRGMSPAEAVEGVNKFLFDYGALTDFEKNIMKRIIPFYSFMRKNIPLELEMFVEQPNTYKLIEKFFTNVEKQTEGEYIPENYRHEMRQEHITLPWTMEGDTYGISDQLPHNQLDRVFDFRKMLGQTSPVIKTPIEVMTGKYTYTDVPIDGAGDYLANQFFPSKLPNMAMKKEEGAERQAYIAGQLLGFPIQKINKNPEKW